MMLDSVLAAPLIAGLLVTLSHVLLGREVLKRGIIFIDLCIAQVAALGVIAAHAFHLAEGSWLTQLVAIASALLIAALLAWTESRWRHVQEAIIGSVYVLAASIALLLLSHDPHGAEQLNQLLAGQVLWVNWPDLIPLGVATFCVLTLWSALPAQRQRLFYFLFAIAITASVQVIGVFLVFATLILPALAVQGTTGKAAWITGYFIAMAGYLLGLCLSLWLDLPAGPLIVCALAGCSLCQLLVRKVVKASNISAKQQS